MTRPHCRHCRSRAASRPRGLCWGCYCTPGVRDRYPRVFGYYPPGKDDFTPAIPEPTAAPPGSAEKLATLIARAEARQELFHDDDKRNWEPE